MANHFSRHFSLFPVRTGISSTRVLFLSSW